MDKAVIMNDIVLEPVENTDLNIAEMAEFAASIWREYWTSILPEGQAEYMIEKFQSKEAMKRQVESENYSYFYIVADGNRAGYTGLSCRDGYLFLSKLYILKDFRHQHVATRAFPFIVDFAKKHGYDRVVLTVYKGNVNAIRAYEKLNFRKTDATVTDIGSGYVMDDYIMEYRCTD